MMKQRRITMNVFRRELKANRKALIIWCVCMFLLVASGMGKFTSYSSGGESLNAAFAHMPYSIKVLFGIGSFDMSTAGGYYAILFSYIQLAAAIHAALLGAGIIAKEERDKTTEFLLVKPVSRGGVIVSKLLAALVNIVLLNLVSLGSSIVMVSALNKGKDVSAEIAVSMLSMFFVQLVFLTLGAVLAAATRKPASAGSLSVGILLIAFFLAKVTDMTDRLSALNVLTPFKYFDLKAIMDGKGLNAVFVVFSLVLTAVFSVFTHVFYNKRDLNI